MKITWFGGSVLRCYVGGQIIVTNLHAAPAHIDPFELGAAADHNISLGNCHRIFPALDMTNWRPQKPVRLIDQTATINLRLHALGKSGFLAESSEEASLIVVSNDFTDWGAFAHDAVIVLVGDADGTVASAEALLQVVRPTMIALASPAVFDAQFQTLAGQANGSAIQILEPELSIEI